MIDLLEIIATGRMPQDAAQAVIHSAAEELRKREQDADALRDALVRAEEIMAYGVLGKPSFAATKAGDRHLHVSAAIVSKTAEVSQRMFHKPESSDPIHAKPEA